MRFLNTNITIAVTTALLLASFVVTPINLQAQESKNSSEQTKLTNNIREVGRSLEDNVERLIIAKDQREMNQTIRERVDTFKNVIKLSISEADRLMDTMSSPNMDNMTSDNEDFNIWRENKIESLEVIINKLNEEKEDINNKEGNIRLEEIQQIATDFSNWRKNNYLPVKEEVETLDLILKVQNIMSITKERWIKIEADLSLIQQIGAIDSDSELWSILDQTKILIEQGMNNNENALMMFMKDIKEEEQIDIEEKASAEMRLMSLDAEEYDSPPADDGQTKIQPDMEQESIKDLVGSSLQNVRDVYQSFIEMSDFVRELLASTSER